MYVASRRTVSWKTCCGWWLAPRALELAVGLIVAILGLFVAVVSLIVAAVSAGAARRSARAAEASVNVAQRSAGAAEGSAEIAEAALRHARESDDRRARAVVAELVQQVKLEHARGVELSERLLLEWQAASALFGRSSLLERKKAELMTVPDELGRRVERAEQQDLGPDTLRTLSPEELEDLTNGLRADLAYLRRRADGFDDERRELTSRVEHHRLIDAIRQLTPPAEPFPGRS